MAIKTVWLVTHRCGHTREHDLGPDAPHQKMRKRPSERAATAKWLATTDCLDCYKAKRDKQRAKQQAEWVAEKRVSEASEAELWEAACDMPALEGSLRQVRYARTVRHRLIVAAHDHAAGIGVSDDDFAEQVEAPARRVRSARWWLDQGDAEADDIPELVQDGASEPAAQTGSENPF